MSNETATRQPLRILIFALGGEGGGVLMNWIVSAARAAGHTVQATSVPGVAQRTGSTSYYIEIAEPGSTAALNLVPMAGRVDVVIASELVEVARALELGYVAPNLTTLIGSTNRVYATAEKIDMGDGRYDSDRIIAAAEKMAKASHLHDLSELAVENGTFISATLYGALAGSGALPWDQSITESVIGSGASAEKSLKGFEAARRIVTGEGPARHDSTPAMVAKSGEFDDLPESVHEIASHGFDRVCDYQDDAYGKTYAERVRRLAAASDLSSPQSVGALGEACRRLALWMAYEDVARVADLKTRPERFDRIRAEAKVLPGQILKVTEYMKPRAEELADILPVRLGERIMARVHAGKSFPFLGRGIHVRSNGFVGYWLLRIVAQLRRTRRGSLRFGREQASIEEWLTALERLLSTAPDTAEALATLPRLRKGYSDTLERGYRAYDRIFQTIVTPVLGGDVPPATGARLREAISAALADDKHTALDASLSGDSGAEPAVPNLKMTGKPA